MTIRKNSATVLASAILLAFAIPVLGQTQTQPQAQPKQTLSQAYQAARDYDAAYASAKQGLAAAKEKALQAKAGVRPTVNFVASGSQSDLAIVKPVTQRNYDTGGLTLSASYPLWRPANYQALSQAEKSVNIAEASYAQAGFDLMTRVSQAYFDVLLAQDTLTAIFAQKAAINEQLAQAKREFEVGTKTIVDTNEAQARFDQTVAQEAVAQGDLVAKRAALTLLTGDAAVMQAGLRDKPVIALPTPADILGWVARAEEAAVPVQIGQLNYDIAKLEYARNKSNNLPTVDLVASANATRNLHGSGSGAASSTSRASSIGVQMNYPIYAGGALDSKIREAAANQEKARFDLEAARRTAGQAARSAYLGVTYGVAQVKALESSERSSQVLLDSTRLGYQVGVRINLDVLNAQQAIASTRKDLAKARYDAMMATVRLKAATAQLGEDDLRLVDAQLVK